MNRSNQTAKNGENNVVFFKKPEALPVGTWVETDIPARLDRLPWSNWHWKITLALGITWLLDGLEVTLVGSVAAVLTDPSTLHLSESQIGATASIYLIGSVTGSLFFGRLADRWGRKRLFFLTLAVYITATLLTAFSWDFYSFAFFRALTGAGIGGESSAIASAIDELIPARVRGRISLAINSTYWLGTAVGALMSLALLNPKILPYSMGWRLCFVIGAAITTAVLFFRRHLPESPRWLLNHGQIRNSEKVVKQIETDVNRSRPLPTSEAAKMRLRVKGKIRFSDVASVLIHKHRKRSFLGLSLVITQAFAYNAIFFTYALVLVRFYSVPPSRVGLYLLPFAIGNFLGPIFLGRLFDTVGRRIMITTTYTIAGILLAITGYGFAQGWLTAASQTFLWCFVFFFASAAASSAYLTVSELFPVEMRSLAIALFYSVGTAVGGIGAPALFGALIETGERWRVADGYYLGAALLLLGAISAAIWAVPAEGKSLESLSELS